jgi:hypothetical protein
MLGASNSDKLAARRYEVWLIADSALQESSDFDDLRTSRDIYSFGTPYFSGQVSQFIERSGAHPIWRRFSVMPNALIVR